MTATSTAQATDLFARSHDQVVLPWLDEQIRLLLERIEASESWQTLANPTTSPQLLLALMREVYLEIYSYQPQVIEATIATIARMPKSDAKMIQKMLIHQAEEADHGEIALKDYVALGGDEGYARKRRMSSASFIVASLWWGLCKMESPFAYLGGLYLFEGLTPIVSLRAKEILGQRGFPDEALNFIDFHSTEDIKHTNMVRKLLEYVVSKYPGTDESIKYGFECFAAIYPIPVWDEACRRAKLSVIA